MKTGNRWLIAGMTAAALLSSGAATAQTPEVPTAPIPGSTGAGPTGSFQPPPPIRAGQPLSVLVFPFGFGTAEAPAAPADPAAGEPAPVAGLTIAQQEVTNYLTAAVKAGLLSSPYYAVASYHPQSSLVQRGRKDDILRPEHLTDVVSPATGAVDNEKAKTIAYRLGMQSYMVGSIETKEDPKTNTVEVTLDAQVLDSQSGAVLRSAVVTGAAAGAEGVPMQLVRERAAQDAAGKTLPALGIQLVQIAGPAAPAVKGKKAPKAKMTAAEKKAAREAKREAEKAERAEKERARQEEKARKEEEKAERARAKKGEVAIQRDERGARLVSQAPATPAPAAAQPVTGPGNTVPGYSNTAGQPVPYGYALGDTRQALPERKKRGIRIPSWMGIGGFLAGLAMLL